MPRKQYNSIAIQRVSFVAIDIEYHTKRFCGPYASTLAIYVHAYSNNLIFNLSTMSRVRRKVIEDLAIIWSTAVKSLLTKYHDRLPSLGEFVQTSNIFIGQRAR